VPQLIIALAILFGAYYLLRFFARTPPAVLAKYIRGAGGVSALGAGLFLLLRGAFPAAAMLGAFGAFMLGLSKFPGGFNFRNAGGKTPTSRVRSAMIEMELDHATGAMNGTVLAGPMEGRTLDSLTRPDCEQLYRHCLSDDPDGARLLEAYLDRRFAGWRQAGEGEGDARRAGAGRGGFAMMSEDEAYEILGLRKGASREDISRAHRTLMKKFHPDQGGTTDLAARVNEAKDVLMRRHT
jgi:hypothetical protein